MNNDEAKKVSGATEIFRMPSADTTVPDLTAHQKPSRPTLTIVKGPLIGEVFELDDDKITLGRDPSNSIFLNDMTVSRRHATMDLTGLASGTVTVEDLGSLNGTWVDGAIVSKASLRDGSTVQIGVFRLVFHTTGRPKRSDAGA